MDRRRHRRSGVLQAGDRPRRSGHRRVPRSLSRTPNQAAGQHVDRAEQPKAGRRARHRPRYPPDRPRRLHPARRPADPGFGPDDHRPRLHQRHQPQRQRRPARQRERDRPRPTATASTSAPGPRSRSTSPRRDGHDRPRSRTARRARAAGREQGDPCGARPSHLRPGRRPGHRARVRRAPVRGGGVPAVHSRRRRVPAVPGLRRDPRGVPQHTWWPTRSRATAPRPSAVRPRTRAPSRSPTSSPTPTTAAWTCSGSPVSARCCPRR